MHGGAGWDARLNTQLEILGIADRFNDISYAEDFTYPLQG